MFASIRSKLIAAFVAFALVCGLAFLVYLFFIFDSRYPPLIIAVQILLLTLVLGLAGSVLAYMLGSAVTAPIRELSRIISGLTPDQIHTRIGQVKEDETGELAHSFNTLADKLQDALEDLASQRDRINLILSRMGDGIIAVDGEGCITAINQAAEHILGIDPETAVGRSFIETVRDYELDRPVRSCLKTKKSQQEYIDLRSKRLYLGLLVSPLVSEPGCLVLIQDLSRLKKLEAIRRDFVANISHELRTPVASISLLSETLKDGAIDDTGVSRDFLAQMHSEIEKLGQIVDGMSTLARIESGEAKLVKKPVDISALVERVVENMKPVAGKAGLELNCCLLDEPLEVQADAGQIEQVLQNILHNATKFTPPGGRVEASVSLKDGQLLVTVSDTGKGISPENLERIFERFYKIDKSRTGGGTGLGLAIARHLIEAHDGKIWAESTPGKGTCISFTLPL